MAESLINGHFQGVKPSGAALTEGGYLCGSLVPCFRRETIKYTLYDHTKPAYTLPRPIAHGADWT